MVKYVLTEEGKKYLAEDLPEVRLFGVLNAHYNEGPIDIQKTQRLAQEKGINFNIGLAWLKKEGCIIIENLKIKTIHTPSDKLHNALRSVSEGKDVENDILAVLLSRRLVSEQRMTLEEQASRLVGKEVTNLSNELIVTGRWRDVKLKPYNVEAAGKALYPGKKHQYAAFLDWVKARLTALGFEERRGPIIETEFWNMDALFMPQFHSARDIHGVYHLKDPRYADRLDSRLLQSVGSAHERGIAGSTGWGYAYDADRAHRLVMRSHGTAVSVRTVASNPKIPGKYFTISRCFRPDVIDASHLPDFFQIDGIVLDKDLNFRHLVGVLKMFAREFAGAERIRLVPSYFPFTEPSVELLAYHKDIGWLELGGAGIFRPEVTKPFGVNVPVIAWGLGVDRIGMMKMNVKDIREMFSQDLDFIRKKEVVF